MTTAQIEQLTATKGRKKHTYSSLVAFDDTISYEFEQDLFVFKIQQNGGKTELNIKLEVENRLDELTLQNLALKAKTRILRLLKS